MTNLTEGLKVVEKDAEKEAAYKDIKLVPNDGTACEVIKKKKKPAATERDQWSGPLDFIMSMIAYAVGLGKFSESLLT